MGALAFLLTLVPPLEAAAPDSTACLEAVSKTVAPDQKLVLLLREGASMEGTYQGVNGGSLELRMYDDRTSRFTTREIPQAEIASITHREKHMNWAFPVLFGVALGALGLAAGQEIHGDPDFGTQDERDTAVVALPIFGTVVGVALGLAIGAIVGKTTETTVSCGAASTP